MTQHPEFLTEDHRLYAAECRRLAAMARPAQRDVPTMAGLFRQWTERALRIADGYHRPQQGLTLTAKWPAYS